MLSHPYYGLGMSGMLGTSTMGGMGMGTSPSPQPIAYDRVPVGEVEVHREDHVHATDGPLDRCRDWSSTPTIIM